ncbi:MAG: antibiotic biosynthesis monooxygenase family protein [Actinomycetota bacterium]
MPDTTEDSESVAALLCLRAAPGRSDELAELIGRMVEVTNRLHGPIFYGASRSGTDDHVFIVYEMWASRGDVTTHLAAPEYQALNIEARDRGLLVPADDELALSALGDGPIRSMQLRPLT